MGIHFRGTKLCMKLLIKILIFLFVKDKSAFTDQRKYFLVDTSFFGFTKLFAIYVSSWIEPKSSLSINVKFIFFGYIKVEVRRFIVFNDLIIIGIDFQYLQQLLIVLRLDQSFFLALAWAPMSLTIFKSVLAGSVFASWSWTI